MILVKSNFMFKCLTLLIYKHLQNIYLQRLSWFNFLLTILVHLFLKNVVNVILFFN